MVASDLKLKTSKPQNVFFKPLKADFKDLFKALAKGVGHTAVGKWEELGADAADALCALGITTEPGELAFLLVRRAICRALFDLIGESASQQLAAAKKDEPSLIDQLDFSISSSPIDIDRSFLDRPSELPIIPAIQVLVEGWLQGHGFTAPSAKAIAARFSTYFVYALNQEWRQNSKSYAPLLAAVDTPFSKAGEREWAWVTYSALLHRRIQESIFDEPFSLSQIFVPPNAYYMAESSSKDSSDELGQKGRRRVVISLRTELERWIAGGSRDDAVRVISGGPGSGKSSFARVFAAQVALEGTLRVLFVPLHLIDPSKDLVEEVGRFVRDEGVLVQNPLNPESPEPSLLVIFDGLDELATQGKAAAETARAFVREVERTVEKRNLQRLRIRVLISGRELVVQENESEFRRARQVLNLLPYFIARPQEDDSSRIIETEEYVDPAKLLAMDLRQQWWRNYGTLTGKAYEGLPPELSRPDLDEVTAQPLLNYLVALSFSRNKLDFSKEINLNTIYGDLVGAVHERGYEKHRPYASIRHMKPEDFSRVLEEIGLAAWHGDGRTTTVREIEEHCRASGLGALLDAFQEGAKTGVTRLLAAFFFRQYGQRTSGDPTFVFTHKSFGEYLASRRIVRAVDRVVRELERRAKSADEGWDERDTLKHWVQVCGPSPMSRYLHVFLINEMQLRPAADLMQYQARLAKLFGYMLRFGMPMEQLQAGSFKEGLFRSRNAEEALLVALNACARVTQKLSNIEQDDPTAFGAWFKRIQGQRTGAPSVLAANCLSFLDLSNACLDIGDFYGANFVRSSLQSVSAHFTTFCRAQLSRADLGGGTFRDANFEHADLSFANLREARLEESYFGRANLRGTDFKSAKLREAHLPGADLSNANLRGADLRGTNLKHANLQEADLRGAILLEADLRDANLDGARLEGANLNQALGVAHRQQKAARSKTAVASPVPPPTTPDSGSNSEQ